MTGIVIYKKDWENNRYYTEFITLAEWMKQSTSFDFLSEMNFFKNFIKRKIIFSMHNKIRKKMY
jgi:dynein heavy chain